MSDLQEELALILYKNIINYLDVLEIGAVASVLVTALGELPKQMDEDIREKIIIQQATAVVAEGITKDGSRNTEECLQTADELLPLFEEAFEKYKQSKIDIKLNS